MFDLQKCATFEIARHCFDADLAFRIRCRRNRLLGFWVAKQLGMSSEAAAAYARWVVSLGVDHSDDNTTVKVIVDNTEKAGKHLDEVTIRKEMDRLAQIAALEFGVEELLSSAKAA